MARMNPAPFFSLIVLAALMTATPVAASVSATELFLPAVGTGPGVPPSYWYTTIWVFNPNHVPVEVVFSFLRRDQSNTPSDLTETIVVASGEVVQIDNAVSTLFGVQGFGAIRALADEPVQMTSRIFSQSAGQQERDSSGQAFAAVTAQRAIGTGEETHLVGLTNLVGGDFRYNVGFVETTGNEVWFEVALYASAGSSWVSQSIRLRPFEQRQMSVDQLFDGVIGEGDNFRMTVTGGSGNGKVIAFGSRVANGSQDATTFEMSFPPLP
jgi:hypothetical protein